MAGTWLRAVRLNENNNGFYGYVQPMGVHAGQTVLRAYWNIMIWGLWAGEDLPFPPGTCLLRAGLLWAEDGLISGGGDVPTPVTNPEASWMDIETVAPRVNLQVSQAANWYIQWAFPKDESVKAMRRAPDNEDMGLYVCWEFALAPDRLSGFEVQGYNCSVDALLTDVP